MSNRGLVVFAYSFPHKKTADFLLHLKSFGFSNVTVIGAPKVQLKNNNSDIVFNILDEGIGLETEQLCKNLGYQYKTLRHDDVQSIKELLRENNSPELALISGGRIIPDAVINLFSEGVVNFHPGSIPETSGLDSFYWMIENNSKPGTTVHFIDGRVDAGELIFFHSLALSKEDTPAILKYKLYTNQLAALKRFLRLLLNNQTLTTSLIDRPHKNKPIDLDRKKEVIEQFEYWKCEQIRLLSNFYSCFTAIEIGDQNLFNDSYRQVFKEWKNDAGRTLLAEAAYHHRYKIAELLINDGADVNSINDKGTTVLMYSKTKVLLEGNSREKLDFIQYLISKGANPLLVDCFGKNIISYIPEKEINLMAVLKGASCIS